jgi:ribosome-binding factor A
MSSKSRRTHSQLAKSQTSTLSPGGPPASPVGHRQARLEHIISNELQSLISDEVHDPALASLKVLSVHLSVDGGHARVAYAVIAQLHQEQEVGRTSRARLAKAGPFLRVRLSQQLDLKKVPQLSFTFVGVAQPDPMTGGEP